MVRFLIGPALVGLLPALAGNGILAHIDHYSLTKTNGIAVTGNADLRFAFGDADGGRHGACAWPSNGFMPLSSVLSGAAVSLPINNGAHDVRLGVGEASPGGLSALAIAATFGTGNSRNEIL